MKLKKSTWIHTRLHVCWKGQLNQHLKTNCKDRLRTKLDYKRDDFNFLRMNFPFIGNIPVTPVLWIKHLSIGQIFHCLINRSGVPVSQMAMNMLRLLQTQVCPSLLIHELYQQVLVGIVFLNLYSQFLCVGWTIVSFCHFPHSFDIILTLL